MKYSFVTKTGVLREFDNLQEYIRALEAQKHAEALNENRKDFLTEEMRLPAKLSPNNLHEHYYSEK